MVNDSWTHKAVSLSLSRPEDPAAPPVTLLGVNDPRAIAEVAAGRLDLATLNPVVMLARAASSPL